MLANLAVIAVTAAVIVAVAYLTQPPPVTGDGVTPVSVVGGGGAAPEVGKLAPDFQALTETGETVRLSSLIGSPVWLTFGASWCQPCRAENPDIQAAWERYRDQGLKVVQVYMTEDEATVSSYAETAGLTYTKVPDPNSKLAALYRIVGIPSHFFIDRTGVLHQLRIGSLDPEAMDAAVREIMG
jgi:peroxiredoxin